MITAHGTDIDANMSSPFKKPPMPLYFHAPHGRVMEYTAVQGVLRGNAKYYQKIAAGVAQHDYVLTRTQGRLSENSKERYRDIHTGWHPDQARARKSNG